VFLQWCKHTASRPWHSPIQALTPVLRQLHWLPVRQRIEFKMAIRCTRHWTACHHSTWRMTVHSSQPLPAGDFDCLMLLPATFHEPTQLWVIDPSQLLVHICGTIYHFISVTLNYRYPSFAGYWKRSCLAEDRSALRFINVLTYLLTAYELSISTKLGDLEWPWTA